MAIYSIRSIVADEARGGSIDLIEPIDVTDQSGDIVFKVDFKEAFNLRLP